MFITVKINKTKIYLFIAILVIIMIVGGTGYKALKSFKIQNTNSNIDSRLNKNIVKFIESYG